MSTSSCSYEDEQVTRSTEEESESSEETSKLPVEKEEVEEQSDSSGEEEEEDSPSKGVESLKEIAPIPETSKSVPAKRSLEMTHELSNKKMKTSHFQRIFTQEDDLLLLQGAIAFAATTPNIFKNIGRFHESVKDSLSFHPTKGQISRKIRKLRETFFRHSNNQDQRYLELSTQLWGVNGIFSKSEVKPKSKTNVGTTSLSSSSRDVVSFLKGHSGTLFGLGESTLLDCWENVEDEETKRELEHRVKDLKAEQAKLAWKGFELVADIGKVMCRHHASSSSK